MCVLDLGVMCTSNVGPQRMYPMCTPQTSAKKMCTHSCNTVTFFICRKSFFPLPKAVPVTFLVPPSRREAGVDWLPGVLERHHRLPGHGHAGAAAFLVCGGVGLLWG